MTTKDLLHRLIDQLPESSSATAEHLLVYPRDAEPLVYIGAEGQLYALSPGDDPFLKALAKAPQDDEPETDAERQAVEEAKADIVAERTVSHDEARCRLLG